MSFRIVVAGRDAQLRRQLVDALGQGPPEVALAAEETAEIPPDPAEFAALVLCDADAVRPLHDAWPNLATVVVADSRDGDICTRALEAGADDCLALEQVGGGVLARRVRLAVRRRAQRTTAAFANAMDAMVFVDDDRRVIAANAATGRLLEAPVEAIEGRRIDDFIDELDHPTLEAIWGRFVREGRQEGDFRVRRGDGQMVDVEYSASKNVGPGRHLAIVRDVSERRRAESEAEAARDQLQSVIDGLPALVFVKDRDLRYRLANAAMERLIEREPGWVIGRRDDDLLPTDRIAGIRASDLEVLERGSTLQMEETLEIGDRERTFLTYKFPLRDIGGRVVAICGVATDISERLELAGEAEMRARQNAAVADLGRLALTQEGIEDLFAVAARKVSELLGTDYTEVLELVAGADSDLVLRAGEGFDDPPAGHVIPGGHESLAGYAVVSGHRVLVEDTETETRFTARGLLDELGARSAIAVPIVGAEGPFGVVGALSRKRRRFSDEDAAFLEAVANTLSAAIARARAGELRRQLEQSQRLDALGQLAGGIAHDFNNLLAVILNYAEFVIEDLPENTPAHQDALNIRLAAQRAAALTRRLLTFGRRDIGDNELIDAGQIVRELEGLLQRTLGAHIDMDLRVGTEPLPVRAAAGHIEQIVLNLSVNARDAMPEGGRLRIVAEVIDLDEGYPAAGRGLTAGRYVRLAVIDSGVGMADEVVERAFDPFFTTKAPGKGTGLGLTTVYGIARQLGGGVHIRSNSAGGTSVSVYLPLAETSAAVPAAQPADDPDSRGQGERILVVEDEDGVRRMVARVLARHGYDVVEARDGAAGLRAAIDPANPIDLMLTDVVMPQLTGPQLVERLRRVHPHAAVLFMSGYTPDVLAEQVREQTGGALLEKPFSSRALLDAVADALGRARARSRT